MKKREMSPAIQLLKIVCNNHGGVSWKAIDGVMQAALEFAISVGLRFGIDDFKIIASSSSIGGFNFWYWGGKNRHMLGEGFYASACADMGLVCGRPLLGLNLSACRAFESWKNRPPFILKTAGNKKGSRLAIGSIFIWNGELVRCTSFSESGNSIVVCLRKNSHKRYRITSAQLREHNKVFKALDGSTLA